MRKLTWLVAFLLTVVVSTTSVSHAQKVRYEYGGPLDRMQTVPLSDVVNSGPLDRVARLEPVKKLRPTHSGVRTNVVGRVARASAYSPARQTSERMIGRLASPPTQVIREALPADVPRSIFDGPLTTPRSYTAPRNYTAPRDYAAPRSYTAPRNYTAPRDYTPQPAYAPSQQSAPRSGYSGALTDPVRQSVEPEYMPRQDEPRQYMPQQDEPVRYEYEYDGPLTGSAGSAVEPDFIPVQEDPTRFGYRDGEAFGFDNKRLYHPLEGPQLNLQGAVTADLGEPGCDEWEDFCQGKDLEHDCACGGLKVNPGHLGLPWLGSKDACDQTVPLLKRRGGDGVGCKSCKAKAAKVCETCGSCPNCGN